MTDDTTSPRRRAAVDAAARAACFGKDGEGCDMCVDPIHCTNWRTHHGTTCMSLAAYEQSMGRFVAAGQLRRMADEG
jgi:hypothetical protein